MIASSLLVGCQFGVEEANNVPKANTTQTIPASNGEKSKVIPFVYTAKKELTLTFNGMGDDATMKKLLDELDKYQIKATFFSRGCGLRKSRRSPRKSSSEGMKSRTTR